MALMSLPRFELSTLTVCQVVPSKTEKPLPAVPTMISYLLVSMVGTGVAVEVGVGPVGVLVEMGVGVAAGVASTLTTA